MASTKVRRHYSGPLLITHQASSILEDDPIDSADVLELTTAECIHHGGLKNQVLAATNVANEDPHKEMPAYVFPNHPTVEHRAQVLATELGFTELRQLGTLIFGPRTTNVTRIISDTLVKDSFSFHRRGHQANLDEVAQRRVWVRANPSETPSAPSAPTKDRRSGKGGSEVEWLGTAENLREGHTTNGLE